ETCDSLTPGVCAPVLDGPDPDTCSGAERCDAHSACKLAEGQPCATGVECATGFCTDGVCCTASACPGTCRACNVPATPGDCSPVTVAPDPDTCAGVNACDSLAQCRLANGQACVDGDECASGHCVDGMCCDQACDGTCEACDAASKGSGPDGTCSFVIAGTDPRGQCQQQSPLSCGFD